MKSKAADFVETATPEKLKQIARARMLTRQYCLSEYSDRKKRMEILTQLFRAIGDNVSIDTPFHCNLGINISIGSNVIIGVNCTFIDDSPILIGDNVLIAPMSKFTQPHIQLQLLSVSLKTGRGKTAHFSEHLPNRLW